jgi:hypothetical protein
LKIMKKWASDIIYGGKFVYILQGNTRVKWEVDKSKVETSSKTQGLLGSQ